MILALLFACRSAGPGDGAEPLDLPAGPGAFGVPVGVRTEVWQGLTLEVWYPAPDDASGTGEDVDFAQFVPESVTALLGPVVFPPIPTRALREAPVRATDVPYPVIVFSHGFGGSRLQSVDYTTHLASRGYVVVATDRGEVDVPLLADWAETGGEGGWLAEAIDAEQLGLTGHSAGGGTTTTVGDLNARFDALLPMAGAGVVTRDVPELVMVGTCDAIVPADGLVSAEEASSSADRLVVAGAGHLAFSDLCTLDFTALYEHYLEPRDDLSAVLVTALLELGTDGCPPAVPVVEVCGDSAFLALDRSAYIVRTYGTLFFDAHLRGGAALAPGLFSEAMLE